MKYIRLVHIKQEPFTFSVLPLGGWNYFKDFLNLDFNFSEVHYLDGDIYVLEGELNKLISYLESNYGRVKELLRLIDSNSSSFLEFCLNNQDPLILKETFSNFLEKYYREGVMGLVMAGLEKVIKDKAERLLSEKISKEIEKSRFEEAIVILSTCLKESNTLSERKALLKLASKYKSNKHSVIDFEKHISSYGWLNCKFFNYTPYTYENILDRIKNIDNPLEELDNLIKNKELLEQKSNNLLNEIKPGQEFLSIIQDLKDITFLRTKRLDSLNLGIYHMKEMIKRIAAEIEEEPEDIPYFLHSELLDLLDKKDINKDQINERKKAYALISKKGEIEVIVGENIKELRKDFSENILKESISGMIASKGTARGYVRIIHEKKDIANMNKGEILVSEMTTPDFIMAMEKAKAIVTDIGGIASHAAIVSRELGIPCIVGTENATKLLSNGDLVFVDALEEGKVFIEKKS